MSWTLVKVKNCSGPKALSYTPTSISVCSECLRKFIPVPKDSKICLFCKPLEHKKKEYKVKLFRRAFSIYTYRRENKEKFRQWKREHKQRHPESVKAWNERYRNKNRDRLNFQFRIRYKIKTMMKTVNDNVLVEPIKENVGEITTSSGIILSAPTEITQVRKGIIKYVPLKPSVSVKKGDTIIYSYGIPVNDKGTLYEIVQLKEVLAII